MMAYYCGPCNQHFPSQHAYAVHAAILHTLSHKCTQCGRLFGSEQALSEHKIVVHRVQPLPKLRPKLPTPKPAQRQLLQKPGPDATQPAFERFACKDCAVSFVTQQGLLDHQALIHPSCQDCSRAFASQIALQQHRIHVHSRSSSQAVPAQLQGEVVDPKSIHQGALQLHSAYLQRVLSSCRDGQQSQQHARADVSKGSGGPVKQTFDCQDCEKHFLSLAALEQHAKDVESHKRNFQCWVCNVAFFTKAGLSQHCTEDYLHRKQAIAIKGREGESSSGMVPEKLPNRLLSAPSVVHCEVCNKDFEGLQRLIQHRKDSPAHAHKVRVKSGGESLPPRLGLVQEGKPRAAQAGSFSCRPCQKDFASQAALDQHFSNAGVHMGRVLPSHAEDFVCEECDKTFGSGPALSQHLRDGGAHRSSPFHKLSDALAGHKQPPARVLVDTREQPKFPPAHKQPPAYKPSPSDTMKKVSKMMEKRLAQLPEQASIEALINEQLHGGLPGDATGDGSQFDGTALDCNGLFPQSQDQGADIGRGLEENAGSGLAPTDSSGLGPQVDPDATAQAAPAIAGGTVRHEDECIICLDARRDTLYLPCGHFCFCHECAVHNQEKGNPCPQCRTPIDLVLKVLA